MSLSTFHRALLSSLPSFGALRAPSAVPRLFAAATTQQPLSFSGIQIPEVCRLQPSPFFQQSEVLQASEAYLPPALEDVDSIEAPSVSDIEEAIQAQKRTYQPSVLIKKRRHGFLHRLSTKAGRRILQNRRSQGREVLSR